MPDEIILARMMTALDIQFEKAMHYHNEWYEGDNDYGLPPQVTRHVCVYSFFTNEASSPQLNSPYPSTQPHSSLPNNPEA